ncbi:unnamed protein product, partial [marine sediment metagenome]
GEKKNLDIPDPIGQPEEAYRSPFSFMHPSLITWKG